MTLAETLITATIAAQERVYAARAARAADVDVDRFASVARGSLAYLDAVRRQYRRANPGLPVWLVKAYAPTSERDWAI